MVISHLIADVHWTSVVIMSLFSFAVGYLWHQPYLFGKRWTQENFPAGMPGKTNAPLIFGGTAVLHFMAMAGISAIVSGEGAIYGAMTGLLASVFWVFPAIGSTYLFAGRSLRLIAIDAGMYVVLYTLSGLFLGIF